MADLGAISLWIALALASYAVFGSVVGKVRGATVLLEMAYPISHGLDFEYPYLELSTYVQQLCDEVGPDRLVWGSDMPNVLRFCTYRQSFEYLKHHDLDENQLSAILGDNLAALFSLNTLSSS